MTYTATPPQVNHIAALVVQARPEWDMFLVRVILSSHASQVDGNDLAIAALRAAADPKLPGPKAIGWRGPHWRDLNTCPPEAKAQQRCNICGRIEAKCYDRRGIDDDHAFEPARSGSR